MKRFLLPFAAMFLFWGCSNGQDEIDGVGAANPDGLVNFSASCATRVVGDSWQDDDRIGLFSGDLYSNLEYSVTSAADGKMSPVSESDKVFSTSDESVEYRAYYPYSQLDGSIYNVDLTNQSDLSQVDLMYASTSQGGAQVDLEFSHQLSKLTLKVNAEAGKSLGSLVCEIRKAYSSAKFDVMSGEMSDFGAGIITLEPTMAADNSSATFEGFVLPTADMSAVEIVFIHNDKDEFVFVPKTLAEGWKSGENYLYNIVLNSAPGSIAVTGVTISSDSETIKVGETLALTASVLPSNATNVNVNWSSSDANVASVDPKSGVVTAKLEGSATITVTTVDGTFTDTCEITVEKAASLAPIKIGDYLYTDGTYSTGFDESKTVDGVVYKVADDAKSGMVVAIDQYDLIWGESADAGALNAGSGLVNTRNVMAVDATFENHAAFANIHTFNDAAETYADGSVGVWYMPAVNELIALVGVAFSDFVSDDVVTSFNAQIVAAGGVAFVGGQDYMSSTQVNGTDKVANFKYVRFVVKDLKVANYGAPKANVKHNRRIKAFKLAE